MKTLVRDYVFNKTNKTITFTGPTYPSSLEEILLVTNVTDGDIIYSFADSLRGGTLTNKILTLTYDTSQMSDSDDIQIFIESNVNHDETLAMLAALLRTVGFSRDANDRMRVILDNSPMLYTYMRNSGTAMAGSTETFYSVGSWNVVDAREQLMAIQNGVLISNMQRWS